MIVPLILFLFIIGQECYYKDISTVKDLSDLPPYKLEQSLIDPIEEVPHELKVLMKKLSRPEACKSDIFPHKPDFLGLNSYYYDLIYGGNLPKIDNYYKMANLFRLLISKLPDPLIPSKIMSQLYELNQYVPTNNRPISFTEMLTVAKVFHRKFVGRETLKHVLMFFSNYAHNGCVPGGFIGIARHICDDLTVPFAINSYWHNCHEPAVYLTISNLLKLGPSLISRIFNIYKHNPQLKSLANSIQFGDHPFIKMMRYHPNMLNKYVSRPDGFFNPFKTHRNHFEYEDFMKALPFIASTINSGDKQDINMLSQFMGHNNFIDAQKNTDLNDIASPENIVKLFQYLQNLLKNNQIQGLNLQPGYTNPLPGSMNNILNPSLNMNPINNLIPQNIYGQGLYRNSYMNQVGTPLQLPDNNNALGSSQLINFLNQIKNGNSYQFPNQMTNTLYSQHTGDANNLYNPNTIGYDHTIFQPNRPQNNLIHSDNHPVLDDNGPKDELSSFVQLLIRFLTTHPEEMNNILEYIKLNPTVISDVLDSLNMEDLRNEYEENLLKNKGNINADIPHFIKFMTKLISGHINKTVKNEIDEHEKILNKTTIDNLTSNLNMILNNLNKIISEHNLVNQGRDNSLSNLQTPRFPSNLAANELSDEYIYRYINKRLGEKDRKNHSPIIINVIPNDDIQKNENSQTAVVNANTSNNRNLPVVIKTDQNPQSKLINVPKLLLNIIQNPGNNTDSGVLSRLLSRYI